MSAASEQSSPLLASLAQKRKLKAAAMAQKEEEGTAKLGKKAKKKAAAVAAAAAAAASSLDTSSAQQGLRELAAPSDRAKSASQSTPKAKRKSKKAPLEVSSKRPVAPVAPKQKVVHARDPRFDDFSGTLNMDLFEKSYAFLDEYRAEEMEQIKTNLKKLEKEMSRRPSGALDEAHSSLRKELQRRVQQDKRRKRQGELRAAELEFKRSERKKVEATGKVPFFHKKSAVRKSIMEKHGKGGRNKEEERREKKLASKEKRKLPERR